MISSKPWEKGGIMSNFHSLKKSQVHQKILQDARSKITANLFFSTPIRNAASASAAKKLPVPASFPVTAYSLMKA